MYHSLETTIWFLIIFLRLKKSLTLFHIWVFLLTFNCFISFGVIENRFTKLTSSILMKIVTVPVVLVDEFYFYMYHPTKTWLFEKTLFELISLKKMVVLPAKLTSLISWSSICIPLILLSALMRLASTSVIILYNNLDSWCHWWTHIWVKGSDRRSCILILESILVYAT